jgi:hypothetical protein
MASGFVLAFYTSFSICILLFEREREREKFENILLMAA